MLRILKIAVILMSIGWVFLMLFVKREVLFIGISVVFGSLLMSWIDAEQFEEYNAQDKADKNLP